MARADRLPNGERRAGDFYPTPPDAIDALRWLIETRLRVSDYRGGRWCDPAAGLGALPFGLQTLVNADEWLLVERDPLIARQLHGMCVERGLSALACEADSTDMRLDADHFVANPPFDQLDVFIRALLNESRDSSFIAVLTRSQWLGEPGRASLRVRGAAPDIEIRMCWRQDFIGDPTKVPNCLHSWLVWLPEHADRSWLATGEVTQINVERPAVTEGAWQTHRAGSRMFASLAS